MDVVGKTCPYCGSKIAIDEETAVCSLCGVPHHLECWRENSGCTTPDCAGGIGAADPGGPAAAAPPTGSAPEDTAPAAGSPEEAPPAPEAGTWHCPKCGFDAPMAAKFCRKCGSPPPLPGQPAAQRCPTCGAEVEADSRFCRKCGYPLSAAQPSAPPVYARPPARPMPPPGYVPPPVYAPPPKPAERYCSRCGMKASPTAAFCMRCGAKLPGPQG
jgi:ribosomal protein L40E